MDPRDPWLLAAMGAGLVAAALAACALPALRATRVPLANVLRPD